MKEKTKKKFLKTKKGKLMSRYLIISTICGITSFIYGIAIILSSYFKTKSFGLYIYGGIIIFLGFYLIFTSKKIFDKKINQLINQKK